MAGDIVVTRRTSLRAASGTTAAAALSGVLPADGDQQLAMLVRRPRETLDELLARLDAAIGKAWDEQES